MQNKNIKKIEKMAFFYIIGVIIYSLFILNIDYLDYGAKSEYFLGDLAFLFNSIYFVFLIFLYHLLKQPNRKIHFLISIWTIIGIISAISLILWAFFGSNKIFQLTICIILIIIQFTINVTVLRKLKNSKNKTNNNNRFVRTDKNGRKYIDIDELGRKIYMES